MSAKQWTRFSRLPIHPRQQVAIPIVLEQGWKILADLTATSVTAKVAILIVLEQGWKLICKGRSCLGFQAVAILIVLEQGWKKWSKA